MKKTRSSQRSRKQPRWQLFEKSNYRLFLIGMGLIILGYIAMMRGPHDSFWSLHLSPVLLVLGYGVMIPLAILKRSHSDKGD